MFSAWMIPSDKATGCSARQLVIVKHDERNGVDRTFYVYSHHKSRQIKLKN